MRSIASVIGGMFIIAGCASLRGGSDPSNLPSGSWTGQVVGNTAGMTRITGRVSLIAGSGSRMRAEIELRNVPHPSRFPWVVLRGSCGETNALEVSSRAVPLLESRPDKTSSLATQVDVRLQSGAAYSLVILLERGSNIVVGCASLAEVA